MNLSFRTLFGGGLLFMGTLILFIAGEQLLRERRYATLGENVEGVVLKKDLRRATSSSSSSYEITYRLTPPGRAPVDRTESVAVDTWEKLEQGSRVGVQHLPGDPESARLQAQRDVIGASVAAAAGVVLWCVAIVLLGMSLRDRLRRRRLLKGGYRAEATVTSVGPTNVTINNRRQWVVKFTYQDHLGHRRAGKTGHLSESDASMWEAGDRGAVMFDRVRPQQHIWVGKD